MKAKPSKYKQPGILLSGLFCFEIFYFVKKYLSIGFVLRIECYGKFF